MSEPPPTLPWRHTHVGTLLSQALARFDGRVLQLMAVNEAVPLGLSNLCARGQLGASHVQITRHLSTQGARLTELARQAGITKQAMGKLVDQCEAWGLVARDADPKDSRARIIRFTALGMAWLAAFESAVAQAEGEMRQALGSEVATVVSLGLEAYNSA